VSEAPAAVEVSLSAEEAEAVLEATAAYAAVVPPDRREPYDGLARAAAERLVPPERLDMLERICVLSLETGKARQLGRAEAERLLNTVYRRTPGGRERTNQAADVNRVLSQLRGRALKSARITSRLPGRYQLSLVVEGFELSIALEPEGLEVSSLQTG